MNNIFIIINCFNSIDKFTRAMEWKGFLVFTKLSYGIYLTQFAVFHYNIGTARSSEQFNTITSIVCINIRI